MTMLMSSRRTPGPGGANARLHVILLVLLSISCLVLVCLPAGPTQAELLSSSDESPARERPPQPTLTIETLLELDENRHNNNEVADQDAQGISGQALLTHSQEKPKLSSKSSKNKSQLSGEWSSPRSSSGAQKQEQRPRLSPVILVPGYGGSRLEAKINKQRAEHYFCEKRTDWTNIWIDIKLMLPYMIDCLIEDFRLVFDESTNTTHNSPGVKIRVKEPADLTTIEYLADIRLTSFGYFAAIIRRLTQAYGYERDVNIRGAPYDFRKAPNELEEYFVKMRQQCEELLELSGQPITFICHSMGCNNVLYFLQRQSQEWKDRHIKRAITLAAPFGGSMQAVRATAFGHDLGMPYLFDEAHLKIVQQSVPSTMYLFPNPRAYGDVPLIRTNVPPPPPPLEYSFIVEDMQQDGKAHEVIKAHDFESFFDKIDHPNGYLMWLNTKDLLRNLKAPGVEVYCLYGRGHSTLYRMDFEGDFPNSKERDHFKDGDGTVTVESATICKEWTKEQKQPVELRPFYAIHADMLKDHDVLDVIETILKPRD